MNKSHRLIWNEITNTWVAVSELTKARGKRASGALLVAASALIYFMPTTVFAAPPNPPAATELPTGGNVVGGQASINQSGTTMNINQVSNRAAVDWNTFNVGSNSTVNFVQPSSSAAILNRVLDANPSQIFGKINANGQVYLTNPNGIYFGRSASVNTGAFAATTHSISNADFLDGKLNFNRNGATGTIENEGSITAALGGYIALLAPEVRNNGVIIARLGTAALAAGETFELQFDANNTLAGLRVTPSTIKALVDNKSAVLAPGGLIILSAQAANKLQAGVINNSGVIEASGIQQRGGRIVLDASDSINNSGSIKANATVTASATLSAMDNGPAGTVQISAPTVINSGLIEAASVLRNVVAEQNNTAPSAQAALANGGSIAVNAEVLTQSATGVMNVSGTKQGGSVTLTVSKALDLSGRLDASAAQSNTPGDTQSNTQGGVIQAQANHISLQSATLDASGDIGGNIKLDATVTSASVITGISTSTVPASPAPAPAPEQPAPSNLILTGNTVLNAQGRRGKGGNNLLLGDTISLGDNTALDARGATGGGTVLVGGDWQGSGTMHHAPGHHGHYGRRRQH